MVKKIKELYRNITGLKNNVHYDIKNLVAIKNRIKEIDYSKLPDQELKAKFNEHRNNIRSNPANGAPQTYLSAKTSVNNSATDDPYTIDDDVYTGTNTSESYLTYDDPYSNKSYNTKSHFKDYTRVKKLSDSRIDLMVDIYAIVFEVVKRTMGICPYDTQLITAIALELEYIVEMQTGEGKTLAAVFPACLNSLVGHGTHVLTFNDYLAKRDCHWMSPIYKFLDINVAYIDETTNIDERKTAYQADITYLTAKESGFDYLKDFLAFDKSDLIQRGYSYAIIDEADSILIDEARIPLVIAGKTQTLEKNSTELVSKIQQLHINRDFYFDQNKNNIFLTDEGLNRIEQLLGCKNLYAKNNTELLARVNCSLFANFILRKDHDYIVRNGKVELIDEFTGRVALKRNWPDNIQEAIEEKEGILNNEKGKILASITLQHFLNLYPKLAGMTGTAITSANEFKEFYKLETVVIPTEKPCIRKDLPHFVFKNKQKKYDAILSEIKTAHNSGQPILVGTSSIEESEHLVNLLKTNGLDCNVLNAKNDELEAEIISKAGDFGTITISTNMAGRGVDIKLGGNNETNKDAVVKTGGLYIIGTAINQNVRIDNQLRGRSGRQGDPGKTRFFISLEDEILVNFGVEKFKNKLENLNLDDDQLLTNKKTINIINVVQRFATAYNTDTRRQLLNYSNFLEDQRKIVQQKRFGILDGTLSPGIFHRMIQDQSDRYTKKFDQTFIDRLEKRIYLNQINKSWANYLEHIAYEKEGIHLVALGNKDPLTEFHKIAIKSFNEMLKEVKTESLKTMANLDLSSNDPTLIIDQIKGPTSTWTYFVDDSFNSFKRNSQLFNNVLYMLVSGY